MTDTEPSELRETVRAKYAEAAKAASACCTGSAGSCGPQGTEELFTITNTATSVFGAPLYDESTSNSVGAALEASLGCGVPTAVADIKPGEIVLDLGSGAGADVLISAGRVAPGGKVYGLDMTSEMLDMARKNAAAAGVSNVEFLEGYLEDIPLPEAHVDVVISNCVINLAADKSVVLAEAARVTKPGGRFAVSDVLADEDMDDATRSDMAAFTGCIAGALTEAEFRSVLTSTGWTDVSIQRTHRVHEAASAAIIRAVRTAQS